MPNCDNCGASMRVDRDRGLFACDHCGSEQQTPAMIAQVELLDDTSSVCPVGSTPLRASRLEGYSLLCCARCFGTLIAMGHFAAVIDAMRASEERMFRVALPRRPAAVRARHRLSVVPPADVRPHLRRPATS